MASIETRPVARVAKESRSSERDVKFPGSTWLRYPNEIYDRFADQKINPRISAVHAIVLGSLADRGYVYQLVTGIEPLRLSVSDFPAYPIQGAKSRSLFSLDLETAKFIGRHSGLLTGDRAGNVAESQIRDWFQRAITFRERFMEHEETRGLIRLSMGHVYMPLSEQGLEQAWSMAGFPEFNPPHSQDSRLSIVHREGVVRRP